MESTKDARLEPRLVAERLFRERYPEAQVLFCAGSVVRGEGTPTSDLDVVVLFDRIERAFRDSFFFTGWPVEVFAPYGGKLFEGYRAEAPAEWRVARGLVPG